MLREILLDDERFSEITERAKARIAEICPAWTDYNNHDPGITMLELFAWLKEMQQFHMDRIGGLHIRNYLKLLGVTPRGKQPAEAVVRAEEYKESLFFPRKSRCFAGDICFETEEETRIDAAEAAELVFCPADREDGRERLVLSGSGMRFLPFGARPVAGNTFFIGLCAPLVPGLTYRLGIHLAQEIGKRNPLADGTPFCPLAEFSFFYQGEHGWIRGEITDDTTHRFLWDGFLALRIGEAGICADGGEEKEKMAVGENGRYWLKFVLEEAGYEVAPALADVSFREIKVRQQRTAVEYHDGCLRPGEVIRLSTYLAFAGTCRLFRREGDRFYPWDREVEKRVCGEEVLFFPSKRPADGNIFYRLLCCEAEEERKILIGKGTGLPHQKYELQIPDVCARELAILVETEEGSGCYVSPKLCDDFTESGPADLVFCYDEETGQISFGDCEHGAAPEGEILLAAACQSFGRRGNVKEGSICQIECVAGGRRIAVSNGSAAAGGRDTETIEECKRRLLAERQAVRRAVTYEDFEALALAAPGLMVEAVRAIPPTKRARKDGSVSEECVTLVVKPYSRELRPVPGTAYCKNILRAIEPGRMIGTRVAIVPPEYIGISVFAEIAAGTKGQEAKEHIREALVDYFAEIRGNFGMAIHVSAIYAVLDILPEVTEIYSLALDAQGRNVRRSGSGDLVLPANGLAYLKECITSISSDRQRG